MKIFFPAVMNTDKNIKSIVELMKRYKATNPRNYGGKWDDSSNWYYTVNSVNEVQLKWMNLI